MRVYKPDIVELEQRFTANIVVVQRRLIAFGDLLPEPGKALELGTPIHTLLIHINKGGLSFEFNEQGNTREASDLDAVQLTDTSLRLVFASGRGPYSGRVSLSPAIEIFDRDTHRPTQLQSLVVQMRATEKQLARIESVLTFLTTITDLQPKPTTTPPRAKTSSSKSKRTSARKRNRSQAAKTTATKPKRPTKGSRR